MTGCPTVFIEIMKVRFVFGLWVGFLLLGMGFARAQAADTKLRVELVWGTNDAKPAEKEFKDLDESVRKKLRALSWKNYFVVKGVDAVASDKDFRRVELSDRCAVEVRQGAGQLEVRIFRLEKGKEPKLVDTKKHDLGKIRAGELFSFGASSKDNAEDAWLVLIRVAPAGS